MTHPVQIEFGLYKSLICKLWDTQNTPHFDEFMVDVFNYGLEIGKSWVSTTATLEIEKKFKKGIFEKRSDDLVSETLNYLFDNLISFERWLSIVNSKMSTYQLEELNYTNRTRKATQAAKTKYDLSSLKPKELSQAEIDAITNEYTGLNLCKAGELKSTERLDGKYIEYRAGHGDSALYVLVGSIFAHAVYVAEHLNTARFMQTAMPLYEKASGSTLLLGEKELIDSILASVPLYQHFEKFLPLVILDEEELQELKERKPARNRIVPKNATTAEIMQRFESKPLIVS